MRQEEMYQKNRLEEYEDEIQVADLIMTVWKWKWLIVGITVAAAIAALVISLSLPKVYRISMVLQPGVLKVQEDGKNVYIDSAENVKSLIDAGTFNDVIQQAVETVGKSYFNIEIKTTIPKNSNTLKVSYDTSNSAKGLVVFEALQKNLLKQYESVVDYYKKDYTTQISILEADMLKFKAEIKNFQENIKNIEKRIAELNAEIGLLDKNTKFLLAERNSFLKETSDGKNVLPAMLYTNTIQQNMELSNSYKNDISYFVSEKETNRLGMESKQNEIIQILEQINNLKFKRDSIQNINILQKPSVSPEPVAPQKKVIIMLATIIGFIFAVFLAFGIEVIIGIKRRTKSMNVT